MSKTSNITMNGIIIDALGNSNFKVELENGAEIICFLSGKMRQRYIKVIPGDRVLIEFSPYDLTKGRISRRL